MQENQKIIKFPEGFLWGSATAAYQVEGGINNCDWAKIYPAGKACDHYNLYEKDFDLVLQLNQNIHRISIEWSRIEPEEGIFDEKEIEHYRKVLESLKRRKIKTMVTLHHFTTPLWLAEKGGFANLKVVFYFSRFSEKVFKEYKNLVDFWVTVNEPINYATIGYLQGRWVPKKKNPILFLKVIKNQIASHVEVYKILHSLDDKVKVGIVNNFSIFEINIFGFKTKILRYFWNDYFFKKIHKNLDFIGVNYYQRSQFSFPKIKGRIFTDIDWEVYSEGIYYVLKDVWQYKLPIYITENGLADSRDLLRKNFIKNHLYWIFKAIQDGVNIKAYLYWSLMDNFEWEKGFLRGLG